MVNPSLAHIAQAPAHLCYLSMESIILELSLNWEKFLQFGYCVFTITMCDFDTDIDIFFIDFDIDFDFDFDIFFFILDIDFDIDFDIAFDIDIDIDIDKSI